MNDGLAVPPPPGERGGFKVPQTAGELRSAIERGELAGDIVYEGEAAKELEIKRKTIIRAGEITSGRLQQAAKDLEAAEAEMSQVAGHDLRRRHQMMQDAMAFRVAAEYLHSVDHPETRNGAAGS